MRAFNSTLRELLEGSKVFAVPLFQRQYSWGRPQWRALWKNIVEQYDFELSEHENGHSAINHFIGSFVLSPITETAPPRILVVDGQQRLITASLLLAALRDLRWERAEDASVRRWIEDDFTKSYLTNSILQPSPETKYRVLPTQEDRDDYFSIVGEVPGRPRGRVGEAYRFFRREARGLDSDGNALDLERVTNVMLSRLSLVEIRTESGDNIHAVFQTLNSSGIALKQIDLLRNHFFMLLPSRGEELYQEVWRDMELRLGESSMDKFFWAWLVSHDPRVSRKTVFAVMQELLDGKRGQSEADVEQVLRRLNDDSREYLKLTEPTEEVREKIRRRLHSLDQWGTDTYYSIGLQLLIANSNARLADEDLAECLLAIESFLVRRMLVGVPTNNLNRIFSALAGSVPREGSISDWLTRSLSASTRLWPDDASVRQAVESRPFAYSGQPMQRRFIFERIEDYLKLQEGARTEIETEPARREIVPVAPLRHIPERSSGVDSTNGSDQAEWERVVTTIGNMALVDRPPSSRELTFSRIHHDLLASELLVNRSVISHSEWTVEAIRERSAELAELVTMIWPGPTRPTTSASEEAGLADDVVSLLPESGYTTVRDLAEFWSRTETEVRQAIAAWPTESRGHVLESFQTSGGGAVKDSLFKRHYSAQDLGRISEEEDAQNLEQPNV